MLAPGVNASVHGRDFDVVFEKGGVYSVRVVRASGFCRSDSTLEKPSLEILTKPDVSDSRLIFSPLTNYEDIYGDSCKVKRDFETQQIIEGVVYDTDGSESVGVMALNCHTGQIFSADVDKSGRFVLNVNEFVDSTVFNVDAIDYIDRRKRFDLSLTEAAIPSIPPIAVTDIGNHTTGYLDFDSAHVLRNIEVTGRKKEAMNRFKIDPAKGYFDGDPAIYRHHNFSSLLKSMGIYKIGGATILLDNQIIQRSTDDGDDYTFDADIESFLNNLNINEIWQVEYIKNDPRTMMFQSAQKGAPVLLIYTKFGVAGAGGPRRMMANSFTPMGYEANVINHTVENEDGVILWSPELVVKAGEKLTVGLSDTDLCSGVTISVSGLTDNGEYIDSDLIIRMQ